MPHWLLVDELEQREHERKDINACVYLSYLSAIYIYLYAAMHAKWW